MTITKYKPQRNRSEVLSPFGLDSIFHSLFNENDWPMTSASGFFKPQVDMIEHKDSFELNVTLPGIKKEDVSIDVKENQLRISGKREETKVNDDSVWHHSEIVKGSFSRSFTLPKNVDKDKIEATMKDGVLSVSIPKGEELKPKAINIK
jgi:HSP20 family protein